MPSQISLDTQSFWIPQKQFETFGNPANGSPFRESAVHEQLCTETSHSSSILCAQELVVDNAARPPSGHKQITTSDQHATLQCSSTVRPASGETRSATDAESPLAGSPGCPSPLVSRSTPPTTQGDEIMEDDELCHVDPHLLDPMVGNASCMNHILIESHSNATGPLTHADALYMSDTIDPGSFGGSTHGPDLALATSLMADKSMAFKWSHAEAQSESFLRNLSYPEDDANMRQPLHAHIPPPPPENENEVAGDMNFVMGKSDDSYPLLHYESKESEHSPMTSDGEESTPKRRRVESPLGIRLMQLEAEEHCHLATSHIGVPKSMSPGPGIASLPSFGSLTHSNYDDTDKAEFEEWPLQNVFLKRIKSDGMFTFQLQFDTNMCSTHSRPGRVVAERRSASDISKPSKTTNNGSCSKANFTLPEDNLIIDLKETQGLSWAEIHCRHQRSGFPFRSKDSLQVRYCTKLKGYKKQLQEKTSIFNKPTGKRKSVIRRKVAEETGLQKHDSPHRLENDTEVYGVECLLERRGKNDFFLEWADGSTGWEPRENILDMEMIEKFESTYQGFDKGVDILETENRGGKLFCRLRWLGRPSTEDEWVREEMMSPRRLVMVQNALHSDKSH